MDPKDKSGYYVWFDSEFTSLDLDRACLLQVALIITDKDLRRVAPAVQDVNLFVRPDGKAVISPWLEENLPGVLQRCRSAEAVDLPEADRRLAACMDEALGAIPEEEALRPILAGNSIHHDWFLARRYLPEFTRRLHYRHLDVSSLKIEWLGALGGQEFDKKDASLVRRYFEDPGLALEAQPHDAFYDVIASIAELRFYRSHLARRDPPSES